MRALALVLLPMLGGCSLIYNESNIPPGPADAAVDAEIDAEIIVDADPSMMNITGVSPALIDEGQGADGSRKALLVVDGEHMVKGSLMVMVTASAGAAKTPLLLVDMAGIDVDANGRRLAVPITLAVDDRVGTGLIAGDEIPLDITVMQTVAGGPTVTRTLAGAVKVRGLNELRGAAPAGFPALSEYSEIALTSGEVKGTAGLTEPVVIKATASITFAASVTTNVNAVTTTGGPGGGNGGAGGAAVNGSSGANGTGPAAGAPSGGPGRYEGDEQLKSHSIAHKNRGSGGAGGDGALLGAGGAGGGGGGTIEITAGGNVTVRGITAQGAAGATGAAMGGGGSGGVVLVRAGGTLTTGTINVTSLGSGEAGRGRYDAAGMATVANAGALFRGPMFVNAPLVTNEQRPMLTVVGQPAKPFQYFFRNSDGSDESMLFPEDLLGTGMKTFALAAPLFPGLNELCLVVAGGDKTSETRNCIDIALLYKPPT